MFSSTVRFNLDPFDERTDEQVWEVLRSVSMFDHVQSLPNKLQELVAEGGDNFSAGQRQVDELSLCCLFIAFVYFAHSLDCLVDLHCSSAAASAAHSCSGRGDCVDRRGDGRFGAVDDPREVLAVHGADHRASPQHHHRLDQGEAWLMRSVCVSVCVYLSVCVCVCVSVCIFAWRK